MAGLGTRERFGRLARAAVLLTLVLAGCSARLTSPGDPFEPINRVVFAFNRRFNHHVTLPAAWVYTYQLPPQIKRPLHNVLVNLQSPVIFANDVLQGHVQGAAETLARFFLNSTFGLAGLNDFARRHAGLPPHGADFGQTLALYGVRRGPFVVLPVIGPSYVRDDFGAVADILADPLFYLPRGWSLLAHTGTAVGIATLSSFQARANALYLRTQLSNTSVDPYATMRSVYRQQRDQELDRASKPAQ